MVKSARDAIPQVEIWVPVINFSGKLTAHHQANLEALNRDIRRIDYHIPTLESERFSTGKGGIPLGGHDNGATMVGARPNKLILLGST